MPTLALKLPKWATNVELELGVCANLISVQRGRNFVEIGWVEKDALVTLHI